MWSFLKNSVVHNSKIVAAILLVFVSVSSYAYEEEEGDTGNAEPSGHWYVGASTGYFKPDGARLGGNTHTLGFQGGYQFNDKWSLEAGFQEDAFSSGNNNLKLHGLNFIRSWGDDVRVLLEFGTTHVSMNGGSSDGATSGFHIGTGLSAFITNNWELRGDLRLPYSMNGHLMDGLGTLSLNYHFVKESAQSEIQSESVLGASTENNQSLPPMQYREPAEAEEPEQTATVAPTPDTTATQAVAPVEQPVVPAESAVVSAQPPTSGDDTSFVAPNAVPKSTHTLLNFGSNSVDPSGQYGEQLDQLSQEIKTSNAKAIIEGHTDDKGSAASNKVLSLDRAIVVKRELKKRGVDGNKLRAVGYGEEHPVAANTTKEGRAQNRRVEVKVYDNQ